MRVAEPPTQFNCSLPDGRSRVRPWRWTTNTSQFSGICWLVTSLKRVIHSDDEFSEVAPFEHADESLRRLLQPIDEVFAIADAAVGDASDDLPQEGGKVCGIKLVVDKASNHDAFGQDCAHCGGQKIGAVIQPRSVVMRNQTRHGDTRELIEERQYGLPHRSADILVIDVDALWAGFLQPRSEIDRLMIDRGVEAERILQEGALFWPARDSHRRGPGNLCELADQRTHRPACRSDDDCLARGGLTDHA